MRLSQLLAGMDVVSCEGDLDVEVGAVTRDSREVQPGDVFVAIQGARVDGHDLVRELGQASAVVVPLRIRPSKTRISCIAST